MQTRDPDSSIFPFSLTGLCSTPSSFVFLGAVHRFNERAFKWGGREGAELDAEALLKLGSCSVGQLQLGQALHREVQNTMVKF